MEKLIGAFRSSGSTIAVELQFPRYFDEEHGYYVSLSRSGLSDAFMGPAGQFPFVLCGLPTENAMPNGALIYTNDDYSIYVGEERFINAMYPDCAHAFSEFTDYAKKGSEQKWPTQHLVSVLNALKHYDATDDYDCIFFPTVAPYDTM